MAKKHYHAMNGSIGCLPDNNAVYGSKKAAIDSLVSLFDGGELGMVTNLRHCGAHYFSNPHKFAAEYCEVSMPCTDPECLKGDD